MTVAVTMALPCGYPQVVAIKKVLQDKRFKNRELQMMRMLAKKDHPNIVSLKHCFYSNGDKVCSSCALVPTRNT